MSDKGLKFDGNKVRLELIPPELLYAVGTILTFGANKYTKEFDNEWERLCSVEGVKKVQLTTQKGVVGLVMKNDLNCWTLSTQNDKGETVEIGNNVTPTKLNFWQKSEFLIQKLEPEIKQPSGEIIWQNLDLTSEGTMNFVRWGARSAEVKNTYTLTIVIVRDNSEVSYVANATTVSGCLEIIWSALKKHFNISKPLNKHEGTRNWELGMKWSRVFGAAMRHAWCWWGGKGPTTKSFLFGELDEETGHSHLWHLGCCVAFLIAYEERGVGEDDRHV